MKYWPFFIKNLVFVLLICIAQLSFSQKNNDSTNERYVFFLHNKFIEDHSLEENHPQYGNPHYYEILNEFKKEGFTVYSEKRPKNTDVKKYAKKIVLKIDSLLNSGIDPGRITVIGTSKGGYIAQYVSTYLANPDVNFVFIGSFREIDLKNMGDINFCGNILNIYEKSDIYGNSAVKRKLTSKLKVTRFYEIELNTGLEHGFLFRPLQEWIRPSILWTEQKFNELTKNPL
jgi:hypothetical protein